MRRSCAFAAFLATMSVAMAAPAAPAFTGIPVAAGQEKHEVKAASSVAMPDGKVKNFQWTPIVRSGETVQKLSGSGPYAAVHDVSGGYVYKQDTSGAKTTTQDISTHPDYTSLLTYEGTMYSITQFERPLPGSAWISELSQSKSGSLSIVKAAPVDFSSVGGIWIPCAGSVTPWGSHLGSEEYEPDARQFDADANKAKGVKDISGIDTVTDMLRYWGSYTDGSKITPADARKLGFFPYNYGFPWEIKITSKMLTTSVMKHYSMGRNALELALVLPDKKTVYISDDGTNCGFNKYIAATAGDLSSGELFCSMFKQTSSVGSTAAESTFDLTWISMGSATDQEIGDKVKTATFFDLFEVATYNSTSNSCPANFKAVNTGGRGAECLRVKSGMEKLASRFETRRYAGYLGCTTELNKFEGMTYDPNTNSLFMAISSWASGMEDRMKDGKASSSFDAASNNDIKTAYNNCGCVIQVKLDGGYSGTSVSSLICGVPIKADKDGNTCDLDGIASPDNVAMVPQWNTLLIGEDTSGHQNDNVWAYNFDKKTVTRIFSTPYGSETTSVYWTPNIGSTAQSFSYITAVVQHPYEDDMSYLTQPGSTGLAGWVGFMGPFDPVASSASAAVVSVSMAVVAAVAALALL